MQDQDREPLATIALIAAFADGSRGPEEVAQLRDDLRALFGQLRIDAQGLYPKVESRIKERARSLNLADVLKQVPA